MRRHLLSTNVDFVFAEWGASLARRNTRNLPKKRHALIRHAEVPVRQETPLERYFRVLEMVGNFPRGITLSQLVSVLGLPKTTVHRILRNLTAAGALATFDQHSGSYRLGRRVLSMLYAGAPDSWIERLALPLLKELADQTGETCFIARLGDLRIHSVAFVTPENTVRGYVVPGRELWPHAAASAKAILAFQDDPIIRAALAPVLPKLTDHTKTRLGDVLREFAEIRRTGIAYCVSEDFQGFAGIACPVHIDNIGVIYSVAITGTVDSLIEQNRTAYERLLRPITERIAAAMEVHLAQAGDTTNRLQDVKST